MKEYVYKIFKILAGWPLSIAALYFVFRMVSPNTANIVEIVKSTNFTMLSIGVLLFVIFYFLRSYIWYRLLVGKSYKIPYRHATFLWAISEIKRYVPGKFWFVLGRAVAFSDKGVAKKDTAKLLIVELEIFALSSLVVSVLSIPFLIKYFLPGNFWNNYLTIAGFAGVMLVVLLYVFNRRLIDRVPQKIKRLINPLFPENKSGELIFLLFFSSIALIFYGLANYFVAVSISFLNPQLIPELIGFFVLSFLLGFLSFFTPAGLGIREGVTAVGLAKVLPFGAAGIVSLFGRIVLVFSELVFLMIAALLNAVKSKKFLAFEKWIGEHPQVAVLVCLFVVYCFYFTVTSFLRYDNFYTGRFDLGNMAQTVWNTSKGRIFVFTNPNATENISRLAFHADFILILFAPAYAVWANPKNLLLIQTLIVGAGVFFVYLIGKDVLKSKNLALLFSFAYLINPSLQRANIYDFHAVTLATFFLLGAFYFYLKKRYLYFSAFAILAALTKEEIWVVVGIFGLLIFIFHKRRILGSAVALVSFLIFYVLIWHAIPNALGSQHFALSYYSEFGDSPTQIIKTTLFSPQKIIGEVLEKERLDYINKLFLPVGYLPLFSPLFLILAMPDFLIDLLSSNPQLHQIYYQYTAPITPFIFVSAIYGAAFLRRVIKVKDIFIVIYLFAFSLSGAYLFGPLPGAMESNLNMYADQLDERAEIEEYISHIPKKLSVAASNNIGSHLSQRQRIYTVPVGIDRADVVVFLLTNKYSESAERDMINKMKTNDEYYLVTEKDKFVVFRKK